MRTPFSGGKTALLFLLFPIIATTQTTLFPGDLVVLGLNANRSGCGDGNVDQISFVSFKDITPSTIIDLTDNGYERRNAGLWGNSEGFVTVVRTGPTIPAGTVITFELPDVGNSDYRALAPDDQWTFTQLSTNTLNFNAGGDQLFFMQGGEWDEGSAAIGQFEHDASYSGGNILFGFNSRPDWTAADDSQSSALPPDIESCAHMEPSTGITDFISYAGLATPATQLEWIQRISDPSNWSSFADCPSYQPPPSTIAILPSGIALSCTVCSGCDAIDETLVFSLPPSGGPFQVAYTDGRDDFLLSGLSDGATISTNVTKTTTFTILSVTDAGGCPVFSNFSDPLEITVGLTPPAAAGAKLSACTSTDRGLYDLTTLHEVLNLGSGRAVRWFADPAPALPIDEPQNFSSPPAVVYAVIDDGQCASAPVAVELTTLPQPTVRARIDGGDACSGLPAERVTLVVEGGTAPYIFDWNDDLFDGQDALENPPPGTYELTITDELGCRDTLSLALSDSPPPALSCAESRSVSIAGAADGQAVVTISDGQPPYLLKWSGPAGGERDITTGGAINIDDLPAGDYDLELTDNNGCQTSCAFTINNPGCDLRVDASTLPPSCSGLADGSIELLISGGTAPYDIDWDVDSLDGRTTASRLQAGTYRLRVTDAGGCRQTQSISLSAQFPALSAEIGAGGFTCESDCYGFPVQLRGRPPFTIHYSIPTGSGPVSRTLVSDEYFAIVEVCPTDLNTGTGSLPVTFTALWDANCRINFSEERLLTVLPEPVTTIDSTLCAGDSLIVNGQVYDQGRPSGREVISGASNSGCDSIVLIDLQFAPRLTAAIEGGGTICSGDSVALTFRFDGASPVDLQYSNSLGETGFLSGISDGHRLRVSPPASTSYTIAAIVASGSSCPADIQGAADVEVGGPQLSLESSTDYDGYGVSCQGSADGALRADISGGAPPYTLTWADGSSETGRQDLPAGMYRLTVTDAAGCSASDSLMLTEPDPLLVQLQAIAPSCPGVADGALVIEAVDGGTPPYSYSLDGGGFQAVSTIPLLINNISGGDHTLDVSDGNGCSTRLPAALPSDPPLVVNAGEDQIIRRGDSLLLSAQVNFPYDSIRWSPATGLRTPLAAETIARPVATQTYQVTAYDSKGCPASDRLTITVEEASRIYAPNAFSPNGDGVNDRFMLFARTAEVNRMTLRVFDRWGSLLYEISQGGPNDEARGWDGTIGGSEAPEGLYLFTAEVEFNDGSNEIVKGGVALVR